MFRLKHFFLFDIYIRSIDERFPTKYRSLRGDGVFTVPCHELFNRYANFKEYVLKRVYRILDSLPRVMRTEHFSQQLLIIREINRIFIVRVFPSPLPKWDKFFTRNPCARTTIDAEKNPERAINNLRYCGNPVETVA